jgi:CTP synthase (UTP-ammonia lyase)
VGGGLLPQEVQGDVPQHGEVLGRVAALDPAVVLPEGEVCSGKLKVRLAPESLTHSIFQTLEIEEEFFCNFELDPVYQQALERTGLRVTGTGEQGEARIVEIPSHRCFLATAFLPQLASMEGRPHPSIGAYLAAARQFQGSHGDGPAARA